MQDGRGPAGGARRAPRAASAIATARPAAWHAAAGRPAAGPDDARGGAARLRARGDRRSRRRSRSRTRGSDRSRSPRAGRPAARPVHRPDQRLPHLAQPLAPPRGAAAASSRAARSGGCASASSSTTCGCGSGRTSSPELRQVCKVDAARARAARSPDRPDADGIHQALLSGLLSHIGLLEEREKERSGGRRPCASTSAPAARGSRSSPAAAWPGRTRSSLMAAELVETSRLWARQNAAIEPAWAERLGGDLVKRTYSEPHWSQEAARRDGPRAGHPVRRAARRRPADLLRQGRPRAGPRALHPARARVRRVAHPAPVPRRQPATAGGGRRARAPGPAPRHRRSTSTLFDFYDARVGPEVVSGAHFDRWWKQTRREQPDLLTFDPAMLVHAAAEEVDRGRLPGAVAGGGLTFPISYHFEPGRGRRRADHRRAGGDAEPGRGRRLLLERPRPAPGAGHQPDPQPAQEPAGQLRAAPPTRRASSWRPCRRGRSRCSTRWSAGAARPPGSSCRASAWDWSKVPEHLRPTYRVVDEDGREQARGKDLEALKEPLRLKFAQAMAEVATDSGLARTGETTWVLRRHRALVHPEARRPRGPGVPCAGRRGRERRAAGLRLGRGARGPAPPRRTTAAAARDEVARVKAVLDGLSNAEKLGLAGSPYPSVAGAARGLPRRGGRRGGRRPPARPGPGRRTTPSVPKAARDQEAALRGAAGRRDPGARTRGGRRRRRSAAGPTW